MAKKKKRFPTYKELVAKKLADKKHAEEMAQKRAEQKELQRIADTAMDFGKQLGISESDILNSMGMYRFGLKYEGAHKLN